jgi:hypothetical protein
MPSHRDIQATTEQHRPPSSAEIASGRPILLAAFPGLVAVPIPASGEIVGRAWLAAAGISDSEISGSHARFSRPGGRLHVEDVGSRNGTWLDGVRQSAGAPVEVEDGQVLRFGRTLFVYRESFTGPVVPAPGIGRLVGPWGLESVRAALQNLTSRPERNVLIQGETGTGKELVAAAVIHALGRGKKPFATINVAGVSADVFEGQLFGWKRGAYSGAVETSRGVIREHQGGSVILDELGELALHLQPKILRLIENREILPVGETRPVEVDVALIGATNRGLDAMVEAGAFRRDLLARFPVRIEIPPLRDRREDIFAILAALRERRGAPIDVRTTEVEAVERLLLDSWPANVRDVDRLIASLDPAQPLGLRVVDRCLGPRIAPPSLTRATLDRVLGESGGNQSEAARRLGVDRARVVRLLRKARDSKG